MNSKTLSAAFGNENDVRFKQKESISKTQPISRVALGDVPIPGNYRTTSAIESLRKIAPRVQIFLDDSKDERAVKAQRTYSQPLQSRAMPEGHAPFSQSFSHPIKPQEAEEDHTDDDLDYEKENQLQGFEHITQYETYEAQLEKPHLESHPLETAHQYGVDEEGQEAAATSDTTQHFTQPASEIDEFEPLEPKWNRTIFNELQDVVKVFSRDTLDEEDEDTYDVTMVAEYAPEIFNYMHELEIKLCPDARYMEHQDELQWGMRGVLIDWIVQVHGRFNLLPETLFLTINYMDRFLSKRKVSLSRFQLVGIVALFIAAKYEEINCPLIHEIAYMVDNSYTVDDLLKAERFMIDVLEFEMGWPGPMSFLRRTSKADDYDYETRTLAKYFLEITIMEPRLVACQPSWLAAGSHYLSRRLLNRGTWTPAHVYYSGYTESQLRPLAQLLLEACRNPEVHHKAIYNKYLERRYRRSAAFVQEYFQAVADEEASEEESEF
ncbi:hypothetical protein BABINDRAFT_161014 [Babjeviella inositovora NRRL Y-12698]|uniref:Uncharacterized protein n=1 Tax=Babjeviella inositovora NRRL Y-12698 TaxID=984486 RepID=A0A1E3QSW5_9ASCO|nr:uncharacterized protein BABINDRAFT_161014 [Babjeviella inositovora NRRL Y-12698]ODQ80805.1 hypothetical protein BABINDRAFT_161014 [Babjeviella inositovora NRRL Y-12698]